MHSQSLQATFKVDSKSMAYREYRESVLDVISASFDPELLLVMKLLKI